MAALMSALAEFAHASGAGQGQQILSVLDRAGWHVSPQVQVPTGIHLHVLPLYSPALQPAERLWPLTAEKLFCNCLIPAALHEGINDVPVLIDGTPEIVACAANPHKHSVQVPCVPGREPRHCY
jgi:hypothetical protein